MTQMMDDRKKRIADGLAAAERGVHEQELAEHRAVQHIKEAKEQAAEILVQAQKRGAEIIEDAKGDAKAEGKAQYLRAYHAKKGCDDPCQKP